MKGWQERIRARRQIIIAMKNDDCEEKSVVVQTGEEIARRNLLLYLLLDFSSVLNRDIFNITDGVG